ncbi:hypothetical protein B9Z55_003165 [Caenorhabditis nigoni]|uniref:Uncharacterized protein n=1 Tax=Caenorhabditis nigoni TaxID=1611254 RepID=A0A2G5VP79_9PELO|nr:hypothetical protein B9Z55_003165 [Caenorhabditis nigoni]
MINGRFKRKPDLGTHIFEELVMYDWFETNCPERVDKCDPAPFDEAIEYCMRGPFPYYLSVYGKPNNETCKNSDKSGFGAYCQEVKGVLEIRSCDPFYTTTTTNAPTNFLPFIIGGIVGIIVLLVIAFGIFCYCKKKKSAGN